MAQRMAGDRFKGRIQIKEANRGKFTAAAKRNDMGVQEFARHVLANKGDYSPAQVKRANFARTLLAGATNPSAPSQASHHRPGRSTGSASGWCPPGC